MDADRERIEAAMRDSRADLRRRTSPRSHRTSSSPAAKRLRPALAVVAGQLSGAPATDDIVHGGVACELVHLGSLYHDDVMDEAETRRGVETVNARWGNLQAILAGDFLLSRASEIAASLGTEVAGLLARTIGWLCEGQIEELRHTYDVARSEESYLASLHGKTASLFGTAARIGGIVAGLDRDLIDALTEYGNAYGMVFQIVDDVLDLTATAERLGKPAGHDMEAGVYTLPVLRTLNNGRSNGDELRDLLGQPARRRRARQGARDRARRRGHREFVRHGAAATSTQRSRRAARSATGLPRRRSALPRRRCSPALPVDIETSSKSPSPERLLGCYLAP